jgi:CubicO group peptidase (beta-lactamase class C family)
MPTENHSMAGLAIRPTIIILSLVGLLVAGPAARALSQSPLPGTPLSAKVDSIFAEWDTSRSPGCAVAVIQGGSTIYKRGYGVADLDHDLAITPATVFHAASLSKQFTAMSVMLLVAQGRLSLDDEVSRHIPELPHLATRLTIGDMLHHLSGIRDQWIFMTMAGWRLSDDVVTRDDVLHFVPRMKALNFKPRDQYLYSNTGYTLAGLIVERVSKRPLADFAHDNIFHPLGMTNTRFAKTHGVIVPNHAYGYRQSADQPYELRMPNYDLVGPTNLLTTVEDLARWDRNFDDKTVGGAAALSQMQAPAQLSNGEMDHYGLGLMLSKYRGLSVVEHDGRDAGYRAHLIRFPDQHFAVACLCNLALPEAKLPGALVRQVADVYLAGQFPVPPGPDPATVAGEGSRTPQSNATPPAHVTSADLAEYAGRYYSEEIETSYNIERQGSSVVLTRQKYPATLLTPTVRDSFTMSNFSAALPAATVRFIRDAQGHVSSFLISGDRVYNFKFSKQK